MAGFCVKDDCASKSHARGMCQKHYLQWWQKENREKAKGYASTSYRRNREQRLAYQRKYREENREKYLSCNRDWHLRTKFGINLDEYERMREAQEGKCAICRSEPRSRELAVDHCHETGKVRGLLCTLCNTALGKFQDDPELLAAAIAYLESDR